jgi:hypothetical protein
MTLAVPTTADAGVMDGSSRLLVTRRDPAKQSYYPLGFLTHDGHSYSFAYLRGVVTGEGIRTLPGLGELTHRYTSERLFPIFAERVISSRRPDRRISMEALGLSVDAAPFEVLQRSGGRRLGDEIEVLPAPTAGSDGRLTVDFLVHGVRYQTLEAQARISELAVGEQLRIVPEADNEWDSRALLVTECDEVPLGYVPGPLLDLMHSAQRSSVSVLRANGPEVGYHFRLLVRAKLCVPLGYQPFSGPGWETVA